MNQLNCSDSELVLRHQGFVRSVAMTAWKSTLGDIELDDLISYGQVGLLQAAKNYDPTSGVEFSTYAFYRIRGAIFDGYSSMQWLSRAQYKRICRQQLADDVIEWQEWQATAENGSDQPEHANWTSEVVGKLFFVHLAFEGREDGETTRQVEDSSSLSPEEAIEFEEAQTAVRHAVSQLPNEERSLINSVYFEGQTLTAAAHSLGKSKSWASRLHDRALQRLLRKLQQVGIASETHSV